MPYSIPGAGGWMRDPIDPRTSYPYEYPGGLNVKPGSDLHNKIRDEVMQRARESRSVISNRYATWRKIDRTLTAYMPTSAAEDKVKAKDERKPVSIVVPTSYATLETLLTYYAAAFLESPIFKYDGMAPEDVYGAILLEKVVDLHVTKNKVGLALHTMWRDALSYGLGVVTPYWSKRYSARVLKQDTGFFDSQGQYISTGAVGAQQDVMFEGNALENIDPYLYLPDPNVPVQHVQRGEFVGWVARTNRNCLLSEEQNAGGELFNCKYLKHADGRSIFYKEISSGREDKTGVSKDPLNSTNPVDVVYMYINVIPKDWKLSSYEYPEKWLFALAGDELVIKAQPLGLNHGLYPVAVCAPNFDGYSQTPVSSLEILFGLQETVDWLFNTHVTNIRKSLNDMLIVDPYMINMQDLSNPEPGKLIRLRKAQWGKGIDNAVKQLAVQDITQNNIKDASYITDMIQRISAATDSLQGIMRTSGERRSATEARDTRGSALSRLEKASKLISMQAMQDIGEMFASHTQQLMSNDVYIKVVGRWEETLRLEYGILDPRVKVSPLDLSIAYDVVPYDNSIGGGEYIDSWVQLYQVLAQNPMLIQQFDVVRIFKHMARLMGAKNIDDFVNKNGGMPQMQAQIMPDEQVSQQAQAGNLMPMDQMPTPGVGF